VRVRVRVRVRVHVRVRVSVRACVRARGYTTISTLRWRLLHIHVNLITVSA